MVCNFDAIRLSYGIEVTNLDDPKVTSLMIISAKVSDHTSLTQLTKLSKAYWGYPTEQMQKWATELTIPPNYIRDNIVYKLIQDKEIVGYYSLIQIDRQTIELDNLFIHPNVIGKGMGSLLLQDAINRSKDGGYTRMKLYADPHATKFYLKKGFEVVGQLETVIPNRFLPIMQRIL